MTQPLVIVLGQRGQVERQGAAVDGFFLALPVLATIDPAALLLMLAATLTPNLGEWLQNFVGVLRI